MNNTAQRSQARENTTDLSRDPPSLLLPVNRGTAEGRQTVGRIGPMPGRSPTNGSGFGNRTTGAAVLAGLTGGGGGESRPQGSLLGPTTTATAITTTTGAAAAATAGVVMGNGRLGIVGRAPGPPRTMLSSVNGSNSETLERDQDRDQDRYQERDQYRESAAVRGSQRDGGSRVERERDRGRARVSREGRRRDSAERRRGGNEGGAFNGTLGGVEEKVSHLEEDVVVLQSFAFQTGNQDVLDYNDQVLERSLSQSMSDDAISSIGSVGDPVVVGGIKVNLTPDSAGSFSFSHAPPNYRTTSAAAVTNGTEPTSALFRAVGPPSVSPRGHAHSHSHSHVNGRGQQQQHHQRGRSSNSHNRNQQHSHPHSGQQQQQQLLPAMSRSDSSGRMMRHRRGGGSGVQDSTSITTGSVETAGIRFGGSDDTQTVQSCEDAFDHAKNGENWPIYEGQELNSKILDDDDMIVLSIGSRQSSYHSAASHIRDVTGALPSLGAAPPRSLSSLHIANNNNHHHHNDSNSSNLHSTSHQRSYHGGSYHDISTTSPQHSSAANAASSHFTSNTAAASASAAAGMGVNTHFSSTSQSTTASPSHTVHTMLPYSSPNNDNNRADQEGRLFGSFSNQGSPKNGESTADWMAPTDESTSGNGTRNAEFSGVSTRGPAQINPNSSTLPGIDGNSFGYQNNSIINVTHIPHAPHSPLSPNSPTTPTTYTPTSSRARSRSNFANVVPTNSGRCSARRTDFEDDSGHEKGPYYDPHYQQHQQQQAQHSHNRPQWERRGNQDADAFLNEIEQKSPNSPKSPAAGQTSPHSPADDWVKQQQESTFLCNDFFYKEDELVRGEFIPLDVIDITVPPNGTLRADSLRSDGAIVSLTEVSGIRDREYVAAHNNGYGNAKNGVDSVDNASRWTSSRGRSQQDQEQQQQQHGSIMAGGGVPHLLNLEEDLVRLSPGTGLLAAVSSAATSLSRGATAVPSRPIIQSAAVVSNTSSPISAASSVAAGAFRGGAGGRGVLNVHQHHTHHANAGRTYAAASSDSHDSRSSAGRERERARDRAGERTSSEMLSMVMSPLALAGSMDSYDDAATTVDPHSYHDRYNQQQQHPHHNHHHSSLLLELRNDNNNNNHKYMDGEREQAHEEQGFLAARSGSTDEYIPINPNLGGPKRGETEKRIDYNGNAAPVMALELEEDLVHVPSLHAVAPPGAGGAVLFESPRLSAPEPGFYTARGFNSQHLRHDKGHGHSNIQDLLRDARSNVEQQLDPHSQQSSRDGVVAVVGSGGSAGGGHFHLENVRPLNNMGAHSARHSNLQSKHHNSASSSAHSSSDVGVPSATTVGAPFIHTTKLPAPAMLTQREDSFEAAATIIGDNSSICVSITSQSSEESLSRVSHSQPNSHPHSNTHPIPHGMPTSLSHVVLAKLPLTSDTVAHTKNNNSNSNGCGGSNVALGRPLGRALGSADAGTLAGPGSAITSSAHKPALANPYASPPTAEGSSTTVIGEKGGGGGVAPQTMTPIRPQRLPSARRRQNHINNSNNSNNSASAATGGGADIKETSPSSLSSSAAVGAQNTTNPHMQPSHLGNVAHIQLTSLDRPASGGLAVSRANNDHLQVESGDDNGKIGVNPAISTGRKGSTTTNLTASSPRAKKSSILSPTTSPNPPIIGSFSPDSSKLSTTTDSPSMVGSPRSTTGTGKTQMSPQNPSFLPVSASLLSSPHSSLLAGVTTVGQPLSLTKSNGKSPEDRKIGNKEKFPPLSLSPSSNQIMVAPAKMPTNGSISPIASAKQPPPSRHSGNAAAKLLLSSPVHTALSSTAGGIMARTPSARLLPLHNNAAVEGNITTTAAANNHNIGSKTYKMETLAPLSIERSSSHHRMVPSLHAPPKTDGTVATAGNIGNAVAKSESISVARRIRGSSKSTSNNPRDLANLEESGEVEG